MRYVYSFRPGAHDSNFYWKPATFHLSTILPESAEVCLTEQEFATFRKELFEVGIVLRYINRVPYVPPEPVH